MQTMIYMSLIENADFGLCIFDSITLNSHAMMYANARDWFSLCKLLRTDH